MPRTTPLLVAGIIEVDASIPVDPFIEAATMLVDRVVAVAEDDDGAPYHSAGELEVIERWLAAHFYCARDGRAVTEGVGPVMTRIESFVHLNLNNSRYGGQAMVLDTSGSLAQWNRDMTKGKRRAAVHWGGIASE